jgi:hypothetical protein
MSSFLKEIIQKMVHGKHDNSSGRMSVDSKAGMENKVTHSHDSDMKGINESRQGGSAYADKLRTPLIEPSVAKVDQRSMGSDKSIRTQLLEWIPRKPGCKLKSSNEML